MNKPLAKRPRWLRFSLRMMLLAVTVFCVWLGFKVNAARRQKEALTAVLKAGGLVSYDYQLITRANGDTVIDADAVPTVPVWLRSLFGDDFFRRPTRLLMNDCVIEESDFSQLGNLDTLRSLTLNNVKVVARKDGLSRTIQNSNLVALEKLTKLETLRLQNVEIEGSGLEPVANLRNLHSLHLINCHFYPSAEPAVEQICKMTNLQSLGLDGCGIGDTAIERLRALPTLEVLSLNDTDISDAALAYLEGFKKLTHLMLNGDNVTAGGIRALKKSLPNCQIHHPAANDPQ
jgi:hypothetical protein